MTNQKGAIGERGWTDGRTSQVSVRMPSAGCHISRQVPSATSNGLVACPRMGFAPSRSFPNEPCSDSWGLTRSHVVFADLHTVLVNAVLVLFRVPQPKPQETSAPPPSKKSLVSCALLVCHVSSLGCEGCDGASFEAEPQQQ